MKCKRCRKWEAHYDLSEGSGADITCIHCLDGNEIIAFQRTVGFEKSANDAVDAIRVLKKHKGW